MPQTIAFVLLEKSGCSKSNFCVASLVVFAVVEPDELADAVAVVVEPSVF